MLKRLWKLFLDLFISDTMLNNRNLLSDNFKDEVKNKVLSGLVYLRDYES